MSGSGLHNDFGGGFDNQGTLFGGNQFNGPVNFNDHSKRISCLQALRLVDPRTEKDRIIANKDKLLKEAYEWIFQDESYLRWRDDGDANLLWIKGDPGKGKTMLMFALIDDLYKKIKSSQVRPDQDATYQRDQISFFICQATDEKLNNSVSVLRGLIYLLVKDHPPYLEHLQNEYEASGPELFNGPHAFYDLQRILMEMLESSSQSGTVYLVIDALDECLFGLSDLLDLVGYTSSQIRVKWIVSSRNIPDIERQLVPRESYLRLSLEMNQVHISRAVQAFIDAKLLELARQHYYHPTLQQKLADILQRQSEGTFLWISLACKILGTVPNWKAESVLQGIPSGLEPLYERMMKQIEENVAYGEICRRILQLVTLGFRPMHVKELELAVGFPDGFSSTSIDWLVELCGSFLTIREDTVYFIHQSAKDYLATGKGAKILPDQRESHGKLAIKLLEHMATNLKMDMCDLKQPGKMISEDLDLKNIISLRYACRYWADHLFEAGDKLDTYLNVPGPVHQFLQTSVLYWFEVLSLIGDLRQGILVMTKLQELIDSKYSSDLVELVDDIYRFILYHGQIIEQAPLQLYSSALIFSPAKARIVQNHLHLLPDWVTQRPLVNDTWSASVLILEGHSKCVNTVAFLPDGKHLVSGSDDETIQICNVKTGAAVAKLEGHDGEISTLAISSDGKYLAAGSHHGKIQLWDMKTKEMMHVFEGHIYKVHPLEFVPGYPQLISGSPDGTIRIWNLEERTGRILSNYSVIGFFVSPDGDRLVSVEVYGEVRLHNLRTGSEEVLEGLDLGETSTVAFSPDGLQVASGSFSCSLQLSDLDDMPYTESLLDTDAYIMALSFSPNGRNLALASDSFILIWDLETNSIIARLAGHISYVQAVQFSPDGQRLASGGADNAVRLWDIRNPGLGGQESLESITNYLMILPGGKYLMSTSSTTVRLWNVETCTVMREKDINFTYPFRVEEISPRRQHVALREGNWISILNTSNWEIVERFSQRIQKNDIFDLLAFSEDEQQFAFRINNKIVQIWNLGSKKMTAELHSCYDHFGTAAFSPDGHLLAMETETIQLWDLRTKTQVGELTVKRTRYRTIAFSPDGQWLVLGGSEGPVQLWNLKTQNHFVTQDSGRFECKFSPDGQFVIAKSRYGVQVWDIEVDFHLEASDSMTSKYQTLSTYPASKLERRRRDHNHLGLLDNWFTVGNTPFLWLPPEYRPALDRECAIAIEDDVVAVSPTAGGILFFKFDLSKIPR